MQKIPVRKFDTRTEPMLAGNFNIRSIRNLLAGKDMVQPLHRHDFFFILVIQKGAGDHAIDFTSCKVRSNSIFFLRPGQVHELKLKAGSIGYLIEFKNDFYSARDKSSGQLLRRASGKNVYQPEGSKFKKLLPILNSIHEEFTNKQEGYIDVIKASLEIFLIELLRQRQNSENSNKASNYSQERLEKFLELLETHIATDKQVSQYADRLNLSGYQLNSITKNLLGKTCSVVIDDQIILESKRLLLATSNQISQIAFELGYEDVSYFIRFFKKHSGFSPEAFRNNFK